jgi:hypothetical protein
MTGDFGEIFLRALISAMASSCVPIAARLKAYQRCAGALPGFELMARRNSASAPEPVAVVVQLDEAERGVAFGQFIVGRDGAERGLLARSNASAGWRLDVPVARALAVGDLGVREREVGIEFDGVFESPDRLAQPSAVRRVA